MQTSTQCKSTVPTFKEITLDEAIVPGEQYLVKVCGFWHVGAFRVNQLGETIFTTDNCSFPAKWPTHIYKICE